MMRSSQTRVNALPSSIISHTEWGHFLYEFLRAHCAWLCRSPELLFLMSLRGMEEKQSRNEKWVCLRVLNIPVIEEVRWECRGMVWWDRDCCSTSPLSRMHAASSLASDPNRIVTGSPYCIPLHHINMPYFIQSENWLNYVHAPGEIVWVDIS